MESIYTDDMGILIPIDFISRFTGTQLSRHHIFYILVGFNLILLSLLFASLGRSAGMRIAAPLLVLIPTIFVPKEVIGPDLFTVYGSLALTSLTVSLLVIQYERWPYHLFAGVLIGYILLLRQSFGILMICCMLFVFCVEFFRKGHHRKKWDLRWGYLVLGFLLVIFTFRYALRLRDECLGLPPDNNPKQHTIFHPLYLGIGNIENNPWGIIYADKYAYDQVYPNRPDLTQKMMYPYSNEYLTKIRGLYLDLWKNDGLRLLKCYISQFFFVVQNTLGFTVFGIGFVYFVFVMVRGRRYRLTSLETVNVAAIAAILALLIQSTLIDYHTPFSYPTGLLGKFLIVFATIDILTRFSPRLKQIFLPIE